jgi:hypothetical protein
VSDIRIKSLKEEMEQYQCSDEAKALKRLNSANYAREQQIQADTERIRQLEQAILGAHASLGLKILEPQTLKAVGRVCSLRQEARTRNMRRAQDAKLQRMGYALTINTSETKASENVKPIPEHSVAAEGSAVKDTRIYSKPRSYQHRIADSAAKLLISASCGRSHMSGGKSAAVNNNNESGNDLYAKYVESSKNVMSNRDPSSQIVFAAISDEQIRLPNVHFDDNWKFSRPSMESTNQTLMSRPDVGDNMYGPTLPPALAFMYLDRDQLLNSASAASRRDDEPVNPEFEEEHSDVMDDFGISDAITMVTDLLNVLKGKYDGIASDDEDNSALTLQQLHTEIEQAIISIQSLFGRIRKNGKKRSKLNKAIEGLIDKRDRIRAQYNVLNGHNPEHNAFEDSLNSVRLQPKADVGTAETPRPNDNDCGYMRSAEELKLLQEVQDMEQEIVDLDTRIAEKEKSIQRLTRDVSSENIILKVAAPVLGMDNDSQIISKSKSTLQSPRKSTKHVNDISKRPTVVEAIPAAGSSLLSRPSIITDDAARALDTRRLSQAVLSSSPVASDSEIGGYPITSYSPRRSSYLNPARKLSVSIAELTLPLENAVQTPSNSLSRQTQQIPVTPSAPTPGRQSLLSRGNRNSFFGGAGIDEPQPTVGFVNIGEALGGFMDDKVKMSTNSGPSNPGTGNSQLRGKMFGSKMTMFGTAVNDQLVSQQETTINLAMTPPPLSAPTECKEMAANQESNALTLPKQMRRRRTTRRSRLKKRSSKRSANGSFVGASAQDGADTAQESDANELDSELERTGIENAVASSEDEEEDGDFESEVPVDRDSLLLEMERAKQVQKAEEAKTQLRNTILHSMLVDDEGSIGRNNRKRTSIVQSLSEEEEKSDTSETVVLSEELLNSALVFSRPTLSASVLKKTLSSTAGGSGRPFAGGGRPLQQAPQQQPSSPRKGPLTPRKSQKTRASGGSSLQKITETDESQAVSNSDRNSYDEEATQSTTENHTSSTASLVVMPELTVEPLKPAY